MQEYLCHRVIDREGVMLLKLNLGKKRWKFEFRKIVKCLLNETIFLYEFNLKYKYRKSFHEKYKNFFFFCFEILHFFFE